MTPAATAPIPLVDLHAQFASIQSEIDEAIRDVIGRCAFIGGEPVAGFERDFADFCNVEHAVGASSGTTALHLALCALGIGPGDEVIAPAHTFIATVEAIAQCGARIVFADIDPQTYTLDPESVARCLTPRTRAILPVHIYGHMADMSGLRKIAGNCDHEVILIEDAAQAHGAERDGVRAGAGGRVGCFSFFPGKNLGACGDAGMVTTNDADLARRMRALANHGRQSKYEHDQMGYNYRLDALQAAILKVKLVHLDRWTKLRRSRAALYQDLLGHTAGITTPHVAEDARHVYHLYVIQVDNRDGLRNYLADRGISAGVHYPIPLHQQPALRRHGFDSAPLKITERIANRIISLPLYPEMTDEQVIRVADAVHRFVGGQ
ncbi:MAG: DegT/DnrJ/EryC1/StrS family aminotransferase [Phycisphaerales bacterium]|nr:DegT/DnrJ/EryC1/StrS family aminotransferase [Phycisphaerales bacterium]